MPVRGHSEVLGSRSRIVQGVRQGSRSSPALVACDSVQRHRLVHYRLRAEGKVRQLRWKAREERRGEVGYKNRQHIEERCCQKRHLLRLVYREGVERLNRSSRYLRKGSAR